MMHAQGKRGRKTVRSVKRDRYQKKHPERGRKTAQIKTAKGLKSRFAK